MRDRNDYIQIAGTVKAVLFQNEENGYSVVKMETDDGELLTAVGCLPFASLGEHLILYGEFTKHVTHGEQFSAEWSERYLPTDADEIFEYLSSGSIKGVGPATATLIVTEFGDKALQVIENEPERLAQIRGISLRKAREISEVFRKQNGLRRLMEFLGNYDIKPTFAVRLFKEYGSKAMGLLYENPYILSGEQVGADFSEADALALELGFESDSPQRVSAAVIFELRHNAGNGHTFIPVPGLIDATCRLIEVPATSVENAMKELFESGDLVRSQIANRDACYLSEFYEAEFYVAARIGEMAKQDPSPISNLSGLIRMAEEETGVSYAELQLKALDVAARRRIVVLTGGPGTGKTTAVRGIVSLYDKMGLKTLLTAPTGRAAKRMSELTGKDASTVHRLLEAGYPEQGMGLVFKRNENQPLRCDAVILDECSMVDICLMRGLLAALPKDCRLVMVGDADQLPSVGPGFVFNDIIRSGVVETVRLTEIFRQSVQSRIVADAHMINRGDYPDLRANTQDSDFFFLNRPGAEAAQSTVIDLCARRLPGNMGIPAREIQVLSPTRRGSVGTRKLNILLQSALNPEKKGKKEKKFGEIIFREGDRVMQIRNNYDIIWRKVNSVKFNNHADNIPVVTMDEKPESGMGVYNGDVGVIVSVDSDSEQLTVLYDDRLAVYGFDMLSELEHAFAVTVHKAQGSEYRAVILLTMDGPPQLMNRCVLYTAVTRARELLVAVGAEGVFYRMIDNHKVTRRFSGLRCRLLEQVAGD